MRIEKKEYVPLALRAQTLWEELERESGKTLLVKTGVLSLGPKGSTVENKYENVQGTPISVQLLTGKEIRKKWPGIDIPEDWIGLYEMEAGVIYCELALSVFKDLSLKQNAQLLTHTQVEGITPHQHYVEVRTNQGTYFSEKLMISVGAWSKKLLTSLGLELPLRPSRRTVGWFEADQTLYSADHFPGFTLDLGDGQSYYGFPCFDQKGVKIGRHDGDREDDPDQLDRNFKSSDEQELRRMLETYLPKAAGKLNTGRVGLYTFTPDSDFIIDQHPDLAGIVIAAGFSGHGFKFASVVGEIASQLLTGERTNHNLAPFSLKRFQR